MKRVAQLALSAKGHIALDQYVCTLQQVEGLSPVTMRNCVSDLRQFMVWCERWCGAQEPYPFTPQAIAPPLLLRYQTYLQNHALVKTFHRQLEPDTYESQTILGVDDKGADHSV